MKLANQNTVDFINERTKLEKEWAELQLQTATGMNKRYQEALEQARANVETVINNKESSLEEIKQAIDEYKIKLSDAITNADLIQQARKAKKDKEAEIANYPQITFEQIVQNYNNLDNVAKPAFDDYESNEDLLKDIENIKNYKIVVSQPKEETKPNENTDSTGDNQTGEETKPSNDHERPKDDNVDNKPAPKPEEPQEHPVITRTKNIIKATEIILDKYDVDNKDKIEPLLDKLKDLLNEPDNKINEIKVTSDELLSEDREFADNFNKKISSTTSHFYNVFKNFRLYDDKFAAGRMVSSFVQVPLLGWNDERNKTITEELKAISEKYLTNKKQQESLDANNDNEFNKSVDRAYKIYLDDIADPQIPGINKQAVDDKYLSIIWESAKLLRGWILKTFNEWWQWLQIAKEYLTPAEYIEMLVKTTLYGLGADTNTDNLLWESNDFFNTKTEKFEPNDHLFVMPDEYAFMVNKSDPNFDQKEYSYEYRSNGNWWGLWDTDSWVYRFNDGIMLYSIFPYIWGAQQFNDITTWINNDSIKPDLNTPYSSKVMLDNFLTNKEYFKRFLDSKTPWYGATNYYPTSEELYNHIFTFSFNFMANSLGLFSSMQVDDHYNAAYIFRDLFRERTELFNQNFKIDVDNYLSTIRELDNLINSLPSLEQNYFNQNLIKQISTLAQVEDFSTNTLDLVEKYNYYKQNLLDTKEEIIVNVYPALKQIADQKVNTPDTNQTAKDSINAALQEVESSLASDNTYNKIQAISALVKSLMF
ncbi:hypothetical protein [Mycoplasma hafezii]|uniref:hypothetical protein n=1 Tax=Mycoplasma hafezii TaxID=525886 RepID=UPI003CFAF37F